MENLDNWKKAGEIAAKARDYGASLIKVGASLQEVTEAVEDKIHSLGGQMAFPPQISLNETAAHYCAEPKDEVIFKEGDVAKIDVGVHVDGCIGDTATTVDLGDNKELVQASQDGLNAALKLIRPGVTLGEIGRAINEAITAHEGIVPIKNLSGHGLGEFLIHVRPSIPNYDTGEKEELYEGQTIAIEPFATYGDGYIREAEQGNIFSLVQKKPVRLPDTRKILGFIEREYSTLPFTTRWLVKKFNPLAVRMALMQLLREDIIRCYPPLNERAKGLVSQAEHSIIVAEKPIITTKLD